jgi:hypothetical protein
VPVVNQSDYRWKVAVEHLMDMPVAGREGSGQSKFAHKDREPDQDRETCVDGSVVGPKSRGLES